MCNLASLLLEIYIKLFSFSFLVFLTVLIVFIWVTWHLVLVRGRPVLKKYADDRPSCWNIWATWHISYANIQPGKGIRTWGDNCRQWDFICQQNCSVCRRWCQRWGRKRFLHFEKRHCSWLWHTLCFVSLHLCQCCYWLLLLIFLCSCKCNPLILVLIHLCNQQCWQVLFFFLDSLSSLRCKAVCSIYLSECLSYSL